MTRVDPTNALAGLLRGQLRTFGRATVHAARRSGVNVARMAQPAAAQPDLAALLASRVQALEPGDPNRRAKAMRLFIEHALMAEFGSALVNDPGFFRMVDEVVSQMTSSAELSEPIEQAVELLLGAR